MFNATGKKTRLWLLILVGVVTTLTGQTHARQIFAPCQPAPGVFAAHTPASTGPNYDVCRYDAPDSLLAAKVTPNPRTGVGYGVTDPPVRVQGSWTEADFKAALQGRPPSSLGRPDLHHAEQMPGSAIHEALPDVHRGNPALHPNRYNQGVTPQMRNQDRQLHWWYRAREEGADQLYPDYIYDN